MENLETVVTVKDYGNIVIRLKDVLEKRNIKRNTLATAIGTRFEVIDNWCDGKLEKIDADIQARICYALQCDVNEILGYENSTEPSGE